MAQKYHVLGRCQWQTFVAEPNRHRTAEGPRAIDAADLKTADGTPLPVEVVAHLVGDGCLKPVEGPPPPADPS